MLTKEQQKRVNSVAEWARHAAVKSRADSLLDASWKGDTRLARVQKTCELRLARLPMAPVRSASERAREQERKQRRVDAEAAKKDDLF